MDPLFFHSSKYILCTFLIILSCSFFINGSSTSDYKFDFQKYLDEETEGNFDRLDNCTSNEQCVGICGAQLGDKLTKCLTPGFCSCNENVEKMVNCREADEPEIIECSQNFRYWNSYIRYMVCRSSNGDGRDICVIYLKEEDLIESSKRQQQQQGTIQNP